MKSHLLSLTIISLFLFLHCTKTLSQSSPAAAPAKTPAAPAVTPAAPAVVAVAPVLVPAPPANAPTPPGPTNVTKILEKASQFTILIRLLKSTQVGDHITTLLNDSNQELTILAPTDQAFSSLKSGTLNSLSDQQKVDLLQFHLLPNFLSLKNFQTLSNPVRTQAGDLYEFPLNVTTYGNSVNISTGLVNTSVSGTIYTDGQLAIYQVDKVLRPIGVFRPRPPPPAPAPAKSKKKETTLEATPKSGLKDDDSGSVRMDVKLMVSINGVLALVASLLIIS